jgi:hypothetical protein
MSQKRRSRRAAERSAPAAASRDSVWGLRITAVVLAVLGVIPTANYVTTGTGLPWWSHAVKLWLVWALVVALIALALGKTIPDRIESAFAWGERMLLAPSSRMFAALLGGVTVVLCVFFGWRLFALEPVVGDEFAQRWQAHLLAMGHLSVLANAHPEFFSTVQTLEVNGRLFSQFPVGGPALLSIGELLRMPWLINPILAGVAAIALYYFVAAFADEVTARISALLFALSPFVLFMSGSQMNHAGTLACVLVALATLPRWLAAEDAKHAGWASAVIGASLGIAATIRPFDAAVVALVIGVFQLHAIRSKPMLWRSLIVQFAAGTLPVLMLLATNAATVGNPFTFAYDALNGPEHRPGFHMTPLGFEHTPVRGLYMASAYLMKLDVGLFGWPVPAILVIVATLALQRRANKWDYLLLAILLGLILGYGAYWSESYFVGPRFLYVAVPVFVYYTARLTPVLRERIRMSWLRSATLLLVPLWLLAAWLIPSGEKQLFGVQQLVEAYKVRPVARTIGRAVHSAGIKHAVVFLPEGWHSRLASRLRALGVRPLAAEQIVGQMDACRLQHALDAAESLPQATAGARAQSVMDSLLVDVPATPLAQQPPSEQLALVRGRAMSFDCQRELAQTMSYGVMLAAMLPYVDLDASGRFGGDIVYARDFGNRNALLKAQYGDRAWYVAQASDVNGQLKVSLLPVQ